MELPTRAADLSVARGPEPAGAPESLLARLSFQVAQRPDHPAVEAPEGTVTYRRLDRLSDALAARLRGCGVRPEARVGVALPRGAREVTTFLAVLKAGGCYVPVDPTHPLERIRVVLEDAAPEVLVTTSDSPLLRAMPAGTKPLPLDAMPEEGGGEAFAAEPATDDQLAYILFTSGTTGRPKGVEIPRGAVANFLRSMEREPGITSADRLLAITTTTFDIAGLELFLPLWAGATVAIADRETASNPRRLRERLERERFTLMQATPATWRLLLDAGWKGDGRLRLLCGGEQMSSALADRLLQAGSELWNVYGPTETTIWSTVDRVRKDRSSITIGRPIDHTQVYVLDELRRIVPPGAVGELWIAGRGLARGYRGRPDLTADRFVPDPNGPPGSRRYRTGDLGRMLEDGRLECLGRIDQQVKIRGFRIELGEIESVCRQVAGVRDVLVVAAARDGEDPLLCAYWVGDARRDALHEAARAKLAPYMVPNAYVNLAEFPLNTNGKIDRQALPRPETGAPAAPGTGPRTIAEERLASIWSEILGLASVGVDQDFFALGGTSVNAIEICARIHRSFGIDLPLRSFFETPTIERLVGQLGKTDVSSEPIVMTLGRGRAEAAPLHCLLGIALFQDLARSLSGQRTVIGMHAPVLYVPGRDPTPSVADVARRYVGAIRQRQPEGPYHLAGLCFGGLVAYEAARQLEGLGHPVATVTVIDGHLPGAERRDWGRRLVRALREPGRALQSLRAKWRASRPPKPPTDGQRPAVDVPLDDPQMNEAARNFERGASGLRAHLLVFRATQRTEPSWVSIQEDFGWQGRAARLSLFTVDAGHLGILQQPHVGEVSGPLMAAMAEGEAARPTSSP